MRFRSDNSVPQLQFQQGSTLTIVLIFSAFSAIAVAGYITAQYVIARPALIEPASYQALLNARSGIWKGLAMLNDSTRMDSVEQTRRADSLLGNDLFEDSAGDSLSFGSEPMILELYGSDRFGNCQIEVHPRGGSLMLSSTGFFREKERHVRALLGCTPFTLPDTVLYLDSAAKPEGLKIFGGISTRLPAPDPDTTGGKKPGRPVLQQNKELKDLIGSYESKLDSMADSLGLPTSHTVQTNADLDGLPELTEGDLFIDGSMHDLRLSSDRTIRVLGDLQVTGDVVIEKAAFVVAGEIRLLDRTHFKNVTLFSRSRIVISDESVYSGNAISLSGYFIYRTAQVIDKSTLLATRQSSKPRKSGTSAKPDSTTQAVAIDLAEKARLDACIISLNDGGTRIGKDVVIRGILWSDGKVCNSGMIEGVLKARTLGGCTDEQPNAPPPLPGIMIMTGTIRQLENIDEYHLPFFMGEKDIVEWWED